MTLEYARATHLNSRNISIESICLADGLIPIWCEMVGIDDPASWAAKLHRCRPNAIGTKSKAWQLCSADIEYAGLQCVDAASSIRVFHPIWNHHALQWIAPAGKF